MARSTTASSTSAWPRPCTEPALRNRFLTRKAAPGSLGVVLALGTTQTLAWASSTYLPAILATPMARDLGISRATVFAAFSVSLLVMAAAGPAVGRAIDKAGGRHMLMVSNVVLAMGLALLGSTQNLAMLFAAWCILGAGMAMGLYDAAFAALVRLYGQDARKPITGITLIAGFASTVGWPLSAYLDAQIGWRGACFVWAALHLVLALPMNWRLIPAVSAPPPEPAGAAPEAGADAQGAAKAAPASASLAGKVHAAETVARRSAQRRTQFFWLGVYFATTAFVTSAYAAHLPGLLTAMGAGAAGAVLAASLLGPAQVAARLAEFGVISRFHVHALTTARAATALHPLAVVVLLLFTAVSAGAPGWAVATAAVFAVLHGAGNGMITIAKGTLPLALFGSAGYGLTQGWLGVGARITQAAAPYASGLVLEVLGGRAFLWLSGVIAALSLGSLYMLRPPAVEQE